MNTELSALIIEDNNTLARTLAIHLKDRDIDTSISTNGKEGLKKAVNNNFDLIVLDISLPGMSGMTIADKLSEFRPNSAVIMITNYEDIDKEVRAYKKGVNIFHKKPIDYTLFKAQVGMLLDNLNNNEIIEIGDLKLDYDKKILLKNEELIELSQKELELMHLLLSSPGEVFSRNEIIRYTNRFITEPEEGSVDTLISRVRRKLGKYKGRQVIETVYKQGYRLNINYLK